MDDEDDTIWQPHWRPIHVGQRVRVKGTKLPWLVTAIDNKVVTVERRDKHSGEHTEQCYLKNQIEPVD